MKEKGELQTRQVFASARREGPSAALRARVLAAGLRELERPPGDPSRVLRPVALRSGVVAGLALAAGVLLFLGLRAERSGPTGNPSESNVAISAEPHAAGERGASAVEERVAKEGAPVTSAAPEPATGTPQLQRTEQPFAASRPAVPRSLKPARESAPPTSAPLESAETAPRAPVQPAPISLGDQLSQLQRARAALRSGQAAQALELLDGYQSQLGGQAFGAEATLLRIEALAATGQRARAAQSARQFLHDYPNSPLVDRAQSLANQLSDAGGAGGQAP